MSNVFTQFLFSKPDASVNAFKAFQAPKKLGRLAMNAAPLAIPAGIFGAWLVWPALTDKFKGDVGLGPKVEE